MKLRESGRFCLQKIYFSLLFLKKIVESSLIMAIYNVYKFKEEIFFTSNLNVGAFRCRDLPSYFKEQTY